MTWYYRDELINEIPDGFITFVYCITNLKNNRKYIGKKLFYFTKTSYKVVKQKNGVKKRKRIKTLVESDWRKYYGSSDELNKEIKSIGTQHFRRDILYLCKSKAEASYLEAKLQFEKGVLETDEYYNGIINVRVGGSNKLRQALLEHDKSQTKSNQ